MHVDSYLMQLNIYLIDILYWLIEVMGLLFWMLYRNLLWWILIEFLNGLLGFLA